MEAPAVGSTPRFCILYFFFDVKTEETTWWVVKEPFRVGCSGLLQQLQTSHVSLSSTEISFRTFNAGRKA